MNQSMNEPAPLHREELGHEGIQGYFSKLKGEAQGEIQVLVRQKAQTLSKGDPNEAEPGHGGQGQPSIEATEQLLLDGQIDGVQLRYQTAGAYFCDTLLRTPSGAKLVRIQQG
jgi:hypothetical protein